MSKVKQASISLTIFLIFMLYYYYINKANSDSKHEHVSGTNRLHRMRTIYNGRYVIKTPGCAIPDYSEELTFKTISSEKSCDERAIFVKKISEHKLKFQIDSTKMKKYVAYKEKYICCYQTVNRSRISRGEDNYISYSPCINFKSGTTINFNYEITKVICTAHYKNKTEAVIYDDVYITLRKVKLNNKIKTKAWNVLLLGMDTMSRTRFMKTMSRTSKLMKQSGWLDYKGYHTTSFESFPNLMAVLSGQNKTTIQKKCEFGMDFCINDTLWAKFKDAGYVTAYGEDFIHSEDSTFSTYGFTMLPTDHYMRPLFLTGEAREDNILCTKKLPSVTHLLDYSIQFVNVYKRGNFFGIFWHKTYDNNGFASKLIDDTFAGFFEKLNKSSILDNTFILFISNHGITHGDFKIPVASYYEERLPILFIWVPFNFRKSFDNKYKNLQKNQQRLTSPYDVFITLSNILKLSIKSQQKTRSDACLNCISIFEEISTYRSCASAGVDEKYCTCHDVFEIDKEEGSEALDTAVSYIKELTTKIDTIPFSTCKKLELDRVLRINTYTSHGNKYIIVAFTMTPGNNSFEALLMRDGKRYRISEPVEGISAYNPKGSCVIDVNDRPYCVCEMSSPCENMV